MILSLVQAFGKDVHREHAGGWTRVFVWLALLFLVRRPLSLLQCARSQGQC